MKVLILGYGLEGKSVEGYFRTQTDVELEILDNFKKEDLLFKDFSEYDLIFRTPSVSPRFINAPKEKVTSVTKYFFDKCPCPIIGVTGTKGKGTTCTLIRDILSSIIASDGLDRNVHLLGNIGLPALDLLPEIKKDDVVVYELSSFQLWDMTKSPDIAVVLRLEPDHLDVHESFEEYLSAKQNIVNYQAEDDYCVYFEPNENTRKLVASSKAKKLSYPCCLRERSADESSEKSLEKLLDNLHVPGQHNRENAEAALNACYAYMMKMQAFDGSFEDFLERFWSEIASTLESFKPLSHHIEFVREFNGVEYYDDSFSTVLPSLEVALKAFSGRPVVLIAGGKDKGMDQTPVKNLIFSQKNLIKVVLIGEIANKLSSGEDPDKYFFAGNDFELAITKAQELAEAKLESEEQIDTCLASRKPEVLKPVVLLSPCASSFDMFESYKQRGDIFKQLVMDLK